MQEMQQIKQDMQQGMQQELVPPEHLNGVKLELDGRLNRDFHPELFLGRARQGFERGERDGNRRRLGHIFNRLFVSPWYQDGDKRLTLSEFISLPVGTVENQQAQDIDDDWVRDRRREFQEVIDANHDGIVTMEELEVNPHP
ncbi:PREDICTED: 45 kDa calcium-binding protein [Sturnus vulgaris]|uniref:45 kDa calcium-binding protein n=1 Tax=Sturnus vulgaris TaxID=9172 RepID=UPI00071A8889|nr:PREDICTED: 45 kDa calcium-binding protein [Sturnus vulgaris]